MVINMKKRNWDKKYIQWGLTAFFTLAASILFYMIIQHWPSLATGISRINEILSPFFWGFVIAYLLCPLMNTFQRVLFAPLGVKLFPRKDKKAFSFARGMSVTLAVVVLLLIIAALLWLILPQLYKSLESLIMAMPSYYSTVQGWITRLLDEYPDINDALVVYLGDASLDIMSWVKSNLLGNIDRVISGVTTQVYLILRGIINALIGLVVACYILYNKEGFMASAKKVIYSVFTPEFAGKLLYAVRFTDRAFIGFISGKLLGSCIVGIVCFIFMMATKMPYPMLISVIIGITDIIPIFGPYIGVIPSAFIILLISPWQCLIFLLFIFLLQQVDSNIVSPKLLGHTTGLSSFWVMFAIIVGAGLFGFMGILFGVPTMTVLYAGATYFVDKKLKRSGLSTEAADYMDLDYIDPDTGEIIKNSPDDMKRKRNEKRPPSPPPPAGQE